MTRIKPAFNFHNINFTTYSIYSFLDIQNLNPKLISYIGETKYFPLDCIF